MAAALQGCLRADTEVMRQQYHFALWISFMSLAKLILVAAERPLSRGCILLLLCNKGKAESSPCHGSQAHVAAMET